MNKEKQSFTICVFLNYNNTERYIILMVIKWNLFSYNCHPWDRAKMMAI